MLGQSESNLQFWKVNNSLESIWLFYKNYQLCKYIIVLNSSNYSILIIGSKSGPTLGTCVCNVCVLQKFLCLYSSLGKSTEKIKLSQRKEKMSLVLPSFSFCIVKRWYCTKELCHFSGRMTYVLGPIHLPHLRIHKCTPKLRFSEQGRHTTFVH